MLENSINMGSKFSHAPARDLVSFMQTMNMASQTFAVDANANDVQTTGNGQAVIASVPFVMAADAALDISADDQLNIWESGESYTSVDMRYVEHQGRKIWYKCIASHTSAAANKPDEDNLRDDATWKTYWVRSTQTAEPAKGDYIPNLHSRYYLALANSAGTITLVKAGDIALDANVTLEIPNFEPEVFVAIGTLLIDSAGFTVGNTSTAGVSTFAQLIGPVFPTGKGIDSN